jgi:hypothetical protein
MRTTQGGPHDYLDVDLNSIADLRRGRGGRTPDAVTSLSPKGFTSRRTLVTQSSIRMGDEHSPIRDLKHRWDEEDKTRDELERQARRAFLKQEANELFAPLENYLTRLDKVIREANAALEIDPTWEHLDERKLRRTAKVILRETAEHLSLDLTIDHFLPQQALPVYPRHRSTHSRYNLGRRAIYYRAKSGYYSRASRFN